MGVIETVTNSVNSCCDIFQQKQNYIFHIAIFTETEIIMKSDKKKKDLDPKKLSTILENAKYVYQSMLTLIEKIYQLKLLITEGISRSQY